MFWQNRKHYRNHLTEEEILLCTKMLIDVSGSSVNGTNVELDPVMFKLQSSLLLAEPGFPLKSLVDCAGIYTAG